MIGQMESLVFYFEIAKSFHLLLPTSPFVLWGSWCLSPAVTVCEAGDTLNKSQVHQRDTKTNETIHTQVQFRATN